MLIQVAPFLPLREPLVYSVPEGLRAQVERGSRVLVPVGSKKAVGVVVRVDVERPEGIKQIKALMELLDRQPVIQGALLDLLIWMAGYYCAPPGEVLRAALPAVLQARERQVLRLTTEGSRVLNSQEALLRSVDDDLSSREREVLDHIQRRGGALTLRRLENRARVVSDLVSRGLISRTAHREVKVKLQTDLLVELNEPVDMASLKRAPRQAELVRLLREAGGHCRLGMLSGRPRDARTIVHRLSAKGLVRVTEVEIPRDPMAAEPVEVDRPPERLTDEQQVALDRLKACSRAGGFWPFLLFGVTGSGKTEVYLRLIADAIDRGKDALVLVPEISLTPQLAARFRARFGNQVAVLHSGLTDAERYGQWRLIRSSQVRIVVGARSAVFAPLENPGVIIVDEEHDPSFKQEEGVRYNARDVALMRAKRVGAVAVLGTATPSLESFHGVRQERLEMLTLRHRATPSPLPEVEVVDLKVYSAGKEGILSAPLAEALAEVLEQGEQAILFLNRRGFSTFVMCKACGEAFRCEHCSVSLTYHRSKDRLVCHYCGYAVPFTKKCPSCEAERIGLLGVGTEQVEEALCQRFTEARVARLDRDTAQGRGLRSILARVGRREVDILVGTQMVTKGHDFPHVTLVGVICADLGLNFPDFRAAERTFQLLTQVAGRAGRGRRPGRVLIQTYNPDHPSLSCARHHDYEAFYRIEIEARQELRYPPAGHLASVRVDGPEVQVVIRAANTLAACAKRLLSHTPEVALLGPTEAPIQRLKGRVRWMLLLKSTARPALRQVLLRLITEAEEMKLGRVRVTLDVDPISML